MRVLNQYHADFLNGEGMREVVFLAGCKHNCKGCFNKETWNFNQGKEWTEEDTKALLKELNKPYISGVTFSGGDPIYSHKDLLPLCKLLKSKNINIWIYTGFLYEEIKDMELLKYVDVLCEGPFIESLKSPNKLWVGSSNQRVINLNLTRNTNSIVLVC